jgi:hypothetical protein
MSEPLSDHQIDEWLAGRLNADPQMVSDLVRINRLIERQRAAAAAQQVEAELALPEPRPAESL